MTKTPFGDVAGSGNQVSGVRKRNFNQNTENEETDDAKRLKIETNEVSESSQKENEDDNVAENSFDSFDMPLTITKVKSPQKTTEKDDSFEDSFDSPICFVQSNKENTPKKRSENVLKTDFRDLSNNSSNSPSKGSNAISPRRRSPKIEQKAADDSFEDSFDGFVEAPKLVEIKESGIDNFPSLRDSSNTVYLKVVSVEKRDGCIDLECRTNDGKKSFVYLQDQWCESKIVAGNSIRLIGAQKWGIDDFVVNDDGGIVIVNPDTLVSCTSIAGATFCARKVVLNDRFRCGGEANKSMLIGTIVHELFQLAVQEETASITTDWLLEIWKTKLLPQCTEELVALLFTPNMFENELAPYLEVVENWINKHIPNKSRQTNAELPSKASVSEVVDIEENIWDPMLGVKGKIDVTLKTVSKDGTTRMESLELKTGKSGLSADHAAQVFLYSMMLSSRYDQKISPGNLLYLKDGVSRNVTSRAPELKSILQQRNGLAPFFGSFDWKSLPEPRTDSRFCEKCEQQTMCAFLQANVENFKGATENMKEFVNKMSAHLEPNHAEYFTRWMQCISAEFGEEKRRAGEDVSSLWLKNADSREAGRSCVGGMILDNEKDMGEWFLITLRRKSPIADGILSIGDICTVSTDSKFGLAFVTVVATGENHLEVRCSRSLKSFESPLHIDRYSSFSNYSTTMGSLIYLMGSDANSNRLRSFVIDLVAPVVDPINVDLLKPEVRRIIVKAKLNHEQRNAVIHALLTPDYTLVEGLPGSGKSTLIAVLVQCLVAMGRSVLMTAFTHSAVDNVLAKLGKDMPVESILRLGSTRSMRDDIVEMAFETKMKKVKDVQKYGMARRLLKNTPVVACTCHHTARELLMSWRRFSVCIVDEASMVSEPVIFPPIAAAEKFVLVGDCQQLAPLVHTKLARNEGAGVSLMQRLQMHKKAMVSLVSQYRMNRNIAAIPSSLFYGGRLVCGSEPVARASLDRNGGYCVRDGINEQMSVVLDGDCSKSCVFVDTNCEKNINLKCEEAPGGVINRGEAELVAEICKNFVESGVKASEIGVMCAYRKQVEVIREIIDDKNVEVNTIDQYQGRDKSVIVWSLTWTDTTTRKSELLKDERRLNVAMTRAKHKLVLIGCKKSLKTISTMHRLIEAIPNHVTVNW